MSSEHRTDETEGQLVAYSDPVAVFGLGNTPTIPNESATVKPVSEPAASFERRQDSTRRFPDDERIS